MRFNQAEYAEFYHKQMVHGGYPGKLLPFILSELEGSSTVLDIGSGTGFFSIPLALAGHLITAVEPSSEMINIMEKNSTPGILSCIKTCNTVWENWSGEQHDAAVCVHSLYPMPDIKKAVMLMKESAVKKIIVVRDASGMRTLSGIIRDKLGITSNRDLNSEIINILNELDVNWKAVNIHEERKHFIKDIQEEAESILYQLKLDESFKEDIVKIVKDEIKKNEEKDFFNAIFSDNAYIFQ